MLKVLLWVVSKDYRFLNGAINILDRQHNGLEVTNTVRGTDFSKVDGEDYEVLLVIGAKQIGMNRITQAARQLRLPEEKLLGDWIVNIPGFTLEKYRQLQRSHLSIFSRNCFGGLISNALGLPFRSPFVNITITDKDFVRFMRHPRIYMEEELIFSSKKFSKYNGYDVATFLCGNVPVEMTHYPDFDEAVKKWEERKRKINWSNIFVTMMTNSPEVLQEFDAFPYGKKICFVPFKSDLNSAYYINVEKAFQANPNISRERLRPGGFTWEIVNRSAIDLKFFYDPFDMLLYGKKTPLIDM